MTPWSIACQAPLSMGFSRQEDWSGLPCPPPGNFPDPVIEPTSFTSPALVGGFFFFLPLMPTGNLQRVLTVGQTQMRVSGWGWVGRNTAGEQETGPKDRGPRSDSLL